ncbi:Short chain 3-hydroxyacyl-CoA dehydrogenase [Trichosporon asahii var. asahii CBS 2479]|uniref:Short chain 3-hydroxyacyl-CoA dehydrogenase n=1 Tax=Trichosporon asahii var. asahii (strain ATCC 90039 / CBS 2479 / JCM 2466 / KCTC 7840 / NBRC 103889/ NCYC 2677 / UAMH 7654) TaxID=1186058 RepID=J5TDJ6_TRIAS|nr:Short chain 3-hydroxyacyl-CoA dehydrogenase [Trichosporon asahii var. asahii CBS 2479]EJT50406.1 Short chain 3-hydroxyacyl-CoA dehydrogenase [Trichosporon asahii var. asahii CBS 2479]
MSATKRLQTIQSHLSTAPASGSGSGIAKPEIKVVAVYGAGLMGAGIAQVAAFAGYDGLAIIRKSSERIAKHMAPEGTDTAPIIDGIVKAIKTTTDRAEAVKDADLVIEAIIEDLAIKQDFFKYLDTVANGLLIKEINAKCPQERKKRFGGLHFFNPVPVMRLVEVIRTEDTLPEVDDALYAFGKSLKKKPIRAKDTPGFIVNRLLMPLNREAIRMVERGDATFQDVDTAMKLGAGHPMGPFELFDYVGLANKTDTNLLVGKGWVKRAEQGYIPKAYVEPQGTLIQDLVAQGKLGRKSGEGFYKYEQKGKKSLT